MPQAGNTEAYSATVVYTLRRDTASGTQDAPAVEFDLAEEPDVPGSL